MGIAGQLILAPTSNRVHQKVRETLKMPPAFVLHSLRHTMLTRFGELGLMRSRL